MTELFIKYLKGHVGDIYVWGAQGETNITEKWIRRRETGEKNAKRAIALWEKRKAEGRSPIAAFDCSGLIVKFLLDNKLIKSDMSSRGLYSACEKLNDRSQLAPGDLLFRHNGKRIHHVGAYIGCGLVIEAMSRDDGVVLNCLDSNGAGYWNRYGRLPVLKDSGETEEVYECCKGEDCPCRQLMKEILKGENNEQ